MTDVTIGYLDPNGATDAVVVSLSDNAATTAAQQAIVVASVDATGVQPEWAQSVTDPALAVDVASALSVTVGAPVNWDDPQAPRPTPTKRRRAPRKKAAAKPRKAKKK